MEIELKDFVSETLRQIIEGVVTAQDFARERGAYVAPSILSDHPGIAHTGGLNYANTSIVDFDAAVSASETGEEKGKVGVLIAVLGATVQGRSDVSSSTFSRIKFAIPVTLPTQNK
jgi:hypothetical protein